MLRRSTIPVSLPLAALALACAEPRPARVPVASPPATQTAGPGAEPAGARELADTIAVVERLRARGDLDDRQRLIGAYQGIAFAADPEIHGITGDQSRVPDLADNFELQFGVDIRQEEDLGVSKVIR